MSFECWVEIEDKNPRERIFEVYLFKQLELVQ